MLTIGRWIRLTPAGAVRDGEPVRLEPSDDPLLVALYRRYAGDYPKFFKMDPLCRLGFVASELLLDGEAERFTPREDRAVVLFTRSGSFASDSRYQQTIADPADYYPSPAVFVYTLANIVTGEIAIRNRYLGETSCYLLDGDPVPQMVATVGEAFLDPETRSVLCGWVEHPGGGEAEATLFLVGCEEVPGGTAWTEESVREIMDIQR